MSGSAPSRKRKNPPVEFDPSALIYASASQTPSAHVPLSHTACFPPKFVLAGCVGLLASSQQSPVSAGGSSMPCVPPKFTLTGYIDPTIALQDLPRPPVLTGVAGVSGSSLYSQQSGLPLMFTHRPPLDAVLSGPPVRPYPEAVAKPARPYRRFPKHVPCGDATLKLTGSAGEGTSRAPVRIRGQSSGKASHKTAPKPVRAYRRFPKQTPSDGAGVLQAASAGPGASREPVTGPSTSRAPVRRGGGTRSLKRKAVDGAYAAGGDYKDLGDCDRICAHCGASFWFAEHVRSPSSESDVGYNMCCRSGRVILEYPLDPPDELKHLYQDASFIADIRAYNSMFAMTSFGADIDKEINKDPGVYVFKVAGQVSHWLGSLCPDTDGKPSFLQLYIYDTVNEVSNRLSVFRPRKRRELQPEIVSKLIGILDRNNELVKLFRTARDICEGSNVPDFGVQLYTKVGTHPYGQPADGTLGAIIYDGDPAAKDFDIIVRTRSGVRQRVNNLHPSYMSLQYPLLFPYGEPGWSANMKRNGHSGDDKRLTMNMFYAYQIHDRPGSYTLPLNAGRLYQQYLVDAYISIERNRLDYFERNQRKLRTEFLSGIHDALSRGDTEGQSIGKRIILPSSFTGGPRYMYRHYQDALAICRVHGNPQYFITFTCNVKWPEIQRHMAKFPKLDAPSRPCLIARVFQMKVEAFMAFLKDEKPFGKVAADLYTIEFQKRGLPHCHTLLWVTDPFRIKTPEQIDNYICAEIPDESSEPALYKVITESMIHGPCGLANPGAPCMQNNVCSKRYPMKHEDATRFDKDGHVCYRRRSGGPSVMRNKTALDNRYVVPYNKKLCNRFQAHINVEYCGWSMLIKYLFKYISKGPDRIKYSIDSNSNRPVADQNRAKQPAQVNEIKNFVDGRFICPHEAAWRILNFHIHHRNPAVQSLSVHLEGKQSITFQDRHKLQQVVDNTFLAKTTLTEWLKSNCVDPSGRHLRYIDYLSEFKWVGNGKYWARRATKKRPSIGRLVYVHPSSGELFYLRMLLNHQKGCCSFTDVRTVDGSIMPTYRAACERLGLIGDDKEWDLALEDASVWATAPELRQLFAPMLLFCEVVNPLNLWNAHWEKMADDFRYVIGKDTSVAPYCVPADSLQQAILYELQKMLKSGSSSSSLCEYGLPMPQGRYVQLLANRLIMEEKCYDREALALENQSLCASMHPKQAEIYNLVMDSLSVDKQVLIFLYGHGGTGKTFLWKAITSGLRSIGKVVLAVAASGVASLLLPSGRTAHSRFKIPIDITDESLCNVTKQTKIAELLIESSLIIWDEAPMSDRRCFEALDRTLRDILDKPNVPFGGRSVLLGGDFRQTLPIKKRSTKTEVLSLSLPRSYLWRYFRVFRLTENMRLRRPGSSATEQEAVAVFSSWLLNLGDGNIGTVPDGCLQDVKEVGIPEGFVIPYSRDALQELIDFIYDTETLCHPSPQNLHDKVIFSPKNETADRINSMVLKMSSGLVSTYLSTDSLKPRAQDRGDPELLYPIEYLNGLAFTGIPPHRFDVKVNTPVILLRNLNPSAGLCNGTRLIVTQLLPRLVEATIITGTNIGNRVFIPRISFLHNDKELPFIFKRQQFPLKLCYAMTINKSQGQSLNKIGVYLPDHVFGHGQLYVALSRATSPAALKVLIVPKDDTPQGMTRNVVYSEFLHEIDDGQVLALDEYIIHVLYFGFGGLVYKIIFVQLSIDSFGLFVFLDSIS